MNSQRHQRNASELLFALILIIIQSVLIESQRSQCDPNVLKNCGDVVSSSHFDFDQLAIPKESIDKTCKPIREGAKCIQDYFDKCDTREMKISDFLTEGYKILADTCDMFERTYLPHYECYAKLNYHYQTCVNNIDKISQDIGRVHEATEEQRKKLCCELQNVYNCVLQPTERNCGQDAASALQMVVDKQLPPFLHGMCLAYKDSCPADNSNYNTDNEINIDGYRKDTDKARHGQSGNGGASYRHTTTSAAAAGLSIIVLATFIPSLF